MTGRVEGRVAFITGAARGQGRADAVRLAEEGADIIAVDICGPIETVEYDSATADELAETAELVEKQGRRIVTRTADVRNQAELDDALAEGVGALGRLDIVVANAGIFNSASAHEMTDLQWQTMLDINLTGVWHTAKAAIPTLIEQGEGGSIVLISSVAGLKTMGGGTISYVAAKFGVTGIGKSLAHELTPHRVRVNTVHPTNVDTPMINNALVRGRFVPDDPNPPEDVVRHAFSRINMWPEPWVETIDIANAVLYLASDEARYVTGTSLVVDLGCIAK